MERFITMKLSEHLSVIFVNYILLLFFIGGILGTGWYFYDKYQRGVERELAISLEQKRKSAEAQALAEKEREETRLKYLLEQKRIEQEIRLQRQLEVEKERLIAEEKERVRLVEQERLRKEEELNRKRIEEENRKNYLENVASSANDILISLKSSFPSSPEARTDRNTFDKINPFLIKYNEFITSLQGDKECFSLNSVVELVTFVQSYEVLINDAKKKNDSWDAYIASLNSPERKKQELASKAQAKELANKASADLEKKLLERQRARERQLRIWKASGGDRQVTLGNSKQVN